MASRTFIQTQIARIEHNFGKDRFKVTQDMFELWNDIFKDYDEDGLRVSVDEYLRTSEYPPTVGSIAKIYKAKDDYRKEMLSYLKSKYLWINRWIEQIPTHEEFSWFCKYIMAFKKNERKDRVERIMRDVISKYNITHEKKTFKEWVDQ